MLSSLQSPSGFPVLTLLRLSMAKLQSFLVAQMVKNLPAMQENRVQSLGWEDPPTLSHQICEKKNHIYVNK